MDDHESAFYDKAMLELEGRVAVLQRALKQVAVMARSTSYGECIANTASRAIGEYVGACHGRPSGGMNSCHGECGGKPR